MSRLRNDRAEERKQQAKERTVERAGRTPQEQLKRLDKYGFAAKAERARLEAQINPKK